ncbi:polyphosphate kinase 2 family protein [bacterium]|nr:polyphosphate kinase 2 family protein [bacterium]
MSQTIIVSPRTKIKLKDYDAGYSGGYKRKSEVKNQIAKIQKQISELQELLYAESKHALLIILQAMDAGGKDGTIRHMMSGVNPQGCEVTTFKVPSAEEVAHDFLWRIHKAVPPKGKIGIFNRSHYEDVLVVRVHNLVPKEVWCARYDQINSFEKILVENGIVILKFFRHISKSEQKKRLESRLKDPAKNWKFSEADVQERKYWDDYMEAYEDAINKCSTEWAPWYIIPANKKWYRDLVVGETIVKTMKDLDMKYPELKKEPNKIKIE